MCICVCVPDGVCVDLTEHTEPVALARNLRFWDLHRLATTSVNFSKDGVYMCIQYPQVVIEMKHIIDNIMI